MISQLTLESGMSFNINLFLTSNPFFDALKQGITKEIYKLIIKFCTNLKVFFEVPGKVRVSRKLRKFGGLRKFRGEFIIKRALLTVLLLFFTDYRKILKETLFRHLIF